MRAFLTYSIALVLALLCLPGEVWAKRYKTPGVYVIEMEAGPPPPIEPMPMDTIAIIAPFVAGPIDEPMLVSSQNDFDRIFGRLSRPPGATAENSGYLQAIAYFMHGGKKAFVLRTQSTVPTAQEIELLRNYTNAIGTITLPSLPYVSFKAARPAWAAAAKLVEETHSFLIADPIASAKTPQEANAWAAALPELASSRVAVYFPRIQLQLDNNPIWVSPSGAVAGLYASMETSMGVWKAPAGNNARLKTLETEYKISSRDNEELANAPNGRAINSILKLSGKGVFVGGARTHKFSTNMDYVNMVRFTTMIARSIKQGMQIYVFEPNVQETWDKMKTRSNEFLTRLWKKGALAGSKPDQAFRIQIGLGETMTPQDVVDGRLKYVILFAPTKPNEFMSVTFDDEHP